MKISKTIKYRTVLLLFITLSISCKTEESSTETIDTQWVRDNQNPVFRDIYSNGSYESASDGHIFYDDEGKLQMIYSGDVNNNSSIKLASGTSMSDWKKNTALVFDANADNSDIQKETAFYRKATNGKHQIYYIGYIDNTTYRSQLFLAESDNLIGPYTQITQPIVPRGTIAGELVYCITSPSIVEHEGKLYMVFIGWNDNPNDATEVWAIGAISNNDGYSWSNFQLVDTPITMEGQITKTPNGNFVAVRTAEYQDVEAIYYATSQHPFGPWAMNDTPILIQSDSRLEKNEIIAPQIVFDMDTEEEYLFYTGADHKSGWWIMLAKKD